MYCLDSALLVGHATVLLLTVPGNVPIYFFVLPQLFSYAHTKPRTDRNSKVNCLQTGFNEQCPHTVVLHKSRKLEVTELRIIQYQHNAHIIAKTDDYAEPKFNSNKCKLTDFIVKAYGSIKKPNQNKTTGLH